MSDIKFDKGTVVATTAAMEVFDSTTMSRCMERHVRGDWGDLPEEDRAANEESIRAGGQVMSTYKIGEKELWIISDAADEEGKRITTFLLPEDY
jgi:hypothetical protein